MRWLKGLTVVALLALLGAAAVAAYGYQRYQRFLDAPLAVADGDVLNVASGSGVGAVAAELERRGAIDDALFIKLYLRLHPDAAAIRAGEYRLDPSLTVPALLAKLGAGDVIRYRITIPEGWTYRQMLAAIGEHPQIVQTLPDDAKTGRPLMAAIDRPDVHPEGQFFPDTYQFPRGTSDVALLQRAYDALQRELNDAWAQRDTSPAMPLQTPYEALIMASIIERETGRAGERDRISGVFARRLRINMRLQTDPTVIYGIGDAFDGNIRRSDLRRDTPYNTYTRHGLPPTPIALVGRAALLAAVRPADGTALYFVAKGDGSHAFADTLKAHNRNVRRYQLKK